MEVPADPTSPQCPGSLRLSAGTSWGRRGGVTVEPAHPLGLEFHLPPAAPGPQLARVCVATPQDVKGHGWGFIPDPH